jgi:16S rRNA U516 pseudouridylate synthase RsuA-like enzyme
MLSKQTNLNKANKTNVAKKKRTVTQNSEENRIAASYFALHKSREFIFAKDEASKPWFFAHI